MKNYTIISNCRVCNSDNIKEILDLNEQPLANNYLEAPDETEECFPLKLNLCLNCYHTQLSVVVNPDLMFKNYLYVSGTSKTLHEYFDKFVEICESYSNKKGKILDIACNDGTQLDKFKKSGWKTFGIDPAENLYNLSSKSHNVICGYFNKENCNKFTSKFNLITAQNVFAHVDKVHEFLENCYSILEENGLVFIQTSQADMILNSQFDTIYHEHLSFFNTNSMKICANKNGFSLIDVKKTKIHGGSYVFVLKKGKHSENLSEIEIKNEEKNGIYDLRLYEKYSENCKKVVTDFKRKIQRLQEDKFKVIGYGAAAKGNTFLNFSKIKLDYIIDDNQLKQNKFTPGMKIPIKSIKRLKDEELNNIFIVPLAWNFFNEIKLRTNDYCKDSLSFIKYFPKLEVVK